MGTRESAGVNRIGVGNERVLQRRFSQSLWLGLELYADGGDVLGVATTEGYAGKLLSPVPHTHRVPTRRVAMVRIATFIA